MYTAIVPARSGSKRLPGKNIRCLAGKPLLLWTLEACVRSTRISKVILSTDSEEYWDLAVSEIESDKMALDFRSANEAGDNVKIFDYLKDGADKIFHGCSGKFVLCLPTMPLRSEVQIDQAIELSDRMGRGVFSAVEYDFATSFAFSIDAQGDWLPVAESSPMVTGNTRSQDQLKTYHPNGAIYIRDIDDLGMPGLKTIYQDAVPYIMERALSVDIDTIEDFRQAEMILEALGK